ncbi:MAG: hypothetical protein JXR19_09655 [Bacteroidia bacterium]
MNTLRTLLILALSLHFNTLKAQSVSEEQKDTIESDSVCIIIQGLVRNSLTQQPIEYAMIRVTSNHKSMGGSYTDSQGKYFLNLRVSKDSTSKLEVKCSYIGLEDVSYQATRSTVSFGDTIYREYPQYINFELSGSTIKLSNCRMYIPIYHLIPKIGNFNTFPAYEISNYNLGRE